MKRSARIPQVFRAIIASAAAASAAACASDPTPPPDGPVGDGTATATTVTLPEPTATSTATATIATDTATPTATVAAEVIPAQGRPGRPDECQTCPMGLDGDAICTVFPAANGQKRIQCTPQRQWHRRGRLPAGVDAPAPVEEGAGAWAAYAAFLEDASVHAFGLLARDLEAQGAPSSLVSRCRAARRDEIEHAREMRAIARKLGTEPERAPVIARPSASLEAIALENAVEGCVLETFAALAAVVDADRESDRATRRTLLTIAVDECRHAQLSWDIAAWAERRLDEAARARVRAARNEAIEQLVEAVRSSELGRLAQGLAEIVAAEPDAIARALAA
jgi:hypothetical protein